MKPYVNDSECGAPPRRALDETLAAERVLAMVRAPAVPDPEGLCAALVDGGISTIELTFTIANLPHVLERAVKASSGCGALVGAGTVLTAENARRAIDAGAGFLVTPAQSPDSAEIVRTGHDAGVTVVIGAFTPSEVLSAVAFDADMVKIFPARALGPQFITDLLGPFPGVRLLASGGVSAENARAFLDAGAVAICAGTSVLSPAALNSSDWAAVTADAKLFRAAISGASRMQNLNRPRPNRSRT